jgi:hypothetical protein
MAIGHTLMFDGLAWPAARIVASSAMVFKSYPHNAVYKPPAHPVFTLATTGHGRRWETTRPEGFWRDFAELDIADNEAVTAFVRRRGDPDGMLDANTESHTGHWLNLKALLGTAALAWTPEDATGASLLTKKGLLGYSNLFLRDPDFPVLKDIEVALDPEGPGFAFRAKTLASFMAASAASALERRVAFRRCDHCKSWFEFTRVDARFCSGSCRSFNSQKKEKP